MGGGKRDAAEGKGNAHAPPVRAIQGAIEGQTGTGRGAYHDAEM